MRPREMNVRRANDEQRIRRKLVQLVVLHYVLPPTHMAGMPGAVPAAITALLFSSLGWGEQLIDNPSRLAPMASTLRHVGGRVNVLAAAVANATVEEAADISS